ncbi:hypothetical protein BRARA_I00247 [Brassica rapa]|uniref:F-box/LRR-repeat protein 15/At3g58940/PEG3-like LRR domain-containing protein n=1 Tax=Brassica campestris TaxID=3711 RepID=A0A397XZZ7_BRACM|nr:hypothetical protein BRARA_I00247 [Brassica rapa]
MCSRITNDGLAKALAKLPLLEELEFSYCPLSVESLRLSGRSCPNLKTLKLNRLRLMRFPYESDDDALAIAETMPKLSHLQLFANTLTDAGLNAILDNCPNLEHLDLRECRSVKLSGDLRKRCSKRIKVLREPFGCIMLTHVLEYVTHLKMIIRMPLVTSLVKVLHNHQKNLKRDINRLYGLVLLLVPLNCSITMGPSLRKLMRFWNKSINRKVPLGSIDILENAQKVCTSWRRVCKDTAMWRKIDMRNSGDLVLNLEMMCRHAVDRSQGGLVEIDIWHFGTDSLLNYIADRSSNLRSLRLAMCSPITTDGLTEATVKLPLLEELEVSYCSLSGESLKIVGQSLPNLKTLKLNRIGLLRPRYESDIDALAIAETMHGLRFLQLFGNILTNGGLSAILDNCPNLEHLDLRHCLNVYNVGDLFFLNKQQSVFLKETLIISPKTMNKPINAKLLVAEGMAKRTPSSFELFILWKNKYKTYGSSGRRH